MGDQVTAYDSTTGKAQPETVQHVFINHDDNLLDVTIADAKPTTAIDPKNKQQDAAVAAHGSQAPPSSETIHTTTEHPFLTNDRGFVDAVKLVPGEHVTKLDGSLGVVVTVTIVPGQAVRYNLTVQDEHTFAVGQGQWVVHNNTCNPNDIRFTQDSADSVHEGGHTVDGNIQDLKSGALTPGDMPPIRVFRKAGYMDAWGAKTKYGYTGNPTNLEDDVLYTLDNRRLYEFQKAGLTDIPYEFEDENNVASQRWKFSTQNQGRRLNINR